MNMAYNLRPSRGRVSKSSGMLVQGGLSMRDWAEKRRHKKAYQKR